MTVHHACALGSPVAWRCHVLPPFTERYTAGFPPGEARENWAILRALSAVLGRTLPFDSLAELRRAMVAEVPHLGRIDQVPENAWTPVPRGDMSDGVLATGVRSHYLANPIMRASEVMAELTRLASLRPRPALAAE